MAASIWGDLETSGWISTDPRDGRDIAFALVAGRDNGERPAAEAITWFAEAAGINPKPGAILDGHLLSATITGDHLTITAGDTPLPERPMTAEWADLARSKGEIALVLALVPVPAEAIATFGEHGEPMIMALLPAKEST